MSEYQWVLDNASLAEAAKRWQQAEMLALDTEFERSDTYYPKPGLIQLADGEGVYLIDPLSVDDWQPLAALFADANRPVLMHSASEDLELLLQMTGALPAQLLDTQVAAAMLGLGASLSYQKLVMAVVGVHVPKDETRSNWLLRPLTEQQCDYACLDVLYLPGIYQRFVAQLGELDRLGWWQEEGREACANALAVNGGKAADKQFQRFKSGWKLGPVQQHALRALCQWREEQARERDKPRSWILKDKSLQAIAERMPRHAGGLASIDGIHQGLLRRHGDYLAALCQQQHSAPGTEQVLLPRPLGGEDKARYKALKQVLDAEAERLALPVELLLNRRDGEQLSRSLGRGEDCSSVLRGWRAEALQAALIEFQRQRQEPAPNLSLA